MSCLPFEMGFSGFSYNNAFHYFSSSADDTMTLLPPSLVPKKRRNGGGSVTTTDCLFVTKVDGPTIGLLLLSCSLAFFHSWNALRCLFA